MTYQWLKPWYLTNEPMTLCPHCDSSKVERNGYCASFNAAVRKEERQAQRDQEKRLQQINDRNTFQPKAPISKKSDKLRKLELQYHARVRVWKKENPECMIKANEHCTKVTDDCHHRKGRGIHLLNEDYWTPVCRSCHVYITDNSKEAIQKGWSESRLAVDQTKPTI